MKFSSNSMCTPANSKISRRNAARDHVPRAPHDQHSSVLSGVKAHWPVHASGGQAEERSERWGKGWGKKVTCFCW
jgi:hypothetical protein